VPYAGSRDNNVVASSATANFDYSSAPWVDDRPGVPDDERIKATTSEALGGEKHTRWNDPTGPKRLVFSADGRVEERRGSFVAGRRAGAAAVRDV
jgi:hypothetical protein